MFASTSQLITLITNLSAKHRKSAVIGLKYSYKPAQVI